MFKSRIVSAIILILLLIMFTGTVTAKEVMITKNMQKLNTIVSAAVDPQTGNVMIIWVNKEESYSKTKTIYGVFAKKKKSGYKYSSPVELYTVNNNDFLLFPSITFSEKDRRFLVVFNKPFNDHGNPGVYSILLNANGKKLGEAKLVHGDEIYYSWIAMAMPFPDQSASPSSYSPSYLLVFCKDHFFDDSKDAFYSILLDSNGSPINAPVFLRQTDSNENGGVANMRLSDTCVINNNSFFITVTTNNIGPMYLTRSYLFKLDGNGKLKSAKAINIDKISSSKILPVSSSKLLLYTYTGSLNWVGFARISNGSIGKQKMYTFNATNDNHEVYLLKLDISGKFYQVTISSYGIYGNIIPKNGKLPDDQSIIFEDSNFSSYIPYFSSAAVAIPGTDSVLIVYGKETNSQNNGLVAFVHNPLN